jgi:hypothetical protein
MMKLMRRRLTAMSVQKLMRRRRLMMMSWWVQRVMVPQALPLRRLRLEVLLLHLQWLLRLKVLVLHLARWLRLLHPTWLGLPGLAFCVPC